MTQLALSAIGRDRPGIVAEVTRALLGHSLNITDSQMAVLGGRFTMMLIVDAPEATDLDLVREELARTRERLALDALSLSPLAEADSAAAAADPSHIVTVYGVDHRGSSTPSRPGSPPAASTSPTSRRGSSAKGSTRWCSRSRCPPTPTRTG